MQEISQRQARDNRLPDDTIPSVSDQYGMPVSQIKLVGVEEMLQVLYFGIYCSPGYARLSSASTPLFTPFLLKILLFHHVRQRLLLSDPHDY